MSKSTIAEAGGLFVFLVSIFPILLPITIVVLLVVFGFSFGSIVYYGFTTALSLLFVSLIVLVLLHKIGVVNIKEQPYLLGILGIVFCAGFFSEKLNFFTITPPIGVNSPPLSVTAYASILDAPQISLLIELFVVALILTGLIIAVAKRRRR
ncbi:MAG: hypothetical protein WC325_09325 [Candidatus Bathyarchaeia archaeon]|jgi:hypothetical protein